MKNSPTSRNKRKKANSPELSFILHYKKFAVLFLPLSIQTKREIYIFIFCTIKTKKIKRMRNSLINSPVSNMPLKLYTYNAPPSKKTKGKNMRIHA